jgi:hypothetical protein
MKLTLAATLALVLCLPFVASAQTANECDFKASAWNLVEPWEENARSFANGNVRLALIDTVEPAAAAYHILVLSPPYDELGGRQCRIVSASNGIGFSGIHFDQLVADYDPSVGLMFDVPIQAYNGNTGGFEDGLLSFNLNQATGAINGAVALP